MVIATSIFVLLNIDSMWTQSVDLAHHYALAFRISQQWTLLSSADPTLGEMNIYPRGGHIVAAIIGTFTNSTFLGIQLTALLSISLLWSSAIYILRSFPSPVDSATLVVALILFLINYFVLGLQLHGHEIVGNFFFSQLVGHAFLFFCLVQAMNVEKKIGALWASLLLTPLMLFVATIHLLPALEFLGVIVGLIATFICFENKNKRVGYSSFLTAILILISAIFGILLHPSFSAMSGISQNNGYLELNNISYPVGLISICLLLLSSSAILFVQWLNKSSDKRYLAAKYLAIYGLVTVGLCFIQYILTYFGKGSDYAVKKYGFGLITILIMQLSVLIATLIVDTKKLDSKINSNHGIFNFILLFCLSVVLLFFNFPRVKYIDVSDVVLLERKLISLIDLSIPNSEHGKPSVIIGLEGLPNIINYMFSIAIAKTPRPIAIPGFDINGGLSQPNDYVYIISSSSNKAYGSLDCESLTSGDISIIESRCLADRLISASKCSNTFDFTLVGLVPESLLTGFSPYEGYGRWTIGSTASFKCSSDRFTFKTATIELIPFTYGVLRSQRLQLLVNGNYVYEGDLSEARGVNNPLIVDLTGVPSSESYVLTFKIPDAVSPKEVGFNEDDRKLGFFLKKISLD